MEIDSKPRQIEFARLNINNTVMSKRKLRQLVEEGFVDGWDDPRLPTIGGLRRRGYTPASIRNFCERIGVSKVISTVEYSFLEHCLREDLNLKAKRVMAVLNPLKLIITNYPENKEEFFEIENNPNDETMGKREVRFSREMYIERDDFMQEPTKGYFRLFPGNEVRLKSAYVVKCTNFKKDENGEIVEVYAEYDENSRGGNPADGRKVKGTIQWVDAQSCKKISVNIYDNLFTLESPESEDDFLSCINKESLDQLTNCVAESEIQNAKVGDSYQFMRIGYFTPDSKYFSTDNLVFNKSVGLKDSFKKNK